MHRFPHWSAILIPSAADRCTVFRIGLPSSSPRRRTDAPFSALVCHPHPLGGGNLHNKVVYHAMKALNDPQWGLGLPVLRFNFRGTGLSQGTHDGLAESA